MTWSFGLVLTLAAMAQAQSETPKNILRVPDPHSSDLIFDTEVPHFVDLPIQRLPEDPRVGNEMPIRLDPQQLTYIVNWENRDEGSGLSLAAVDEAARVHLKLPKGQGLIATSVLPQGPAAHAGVFQNDILLTLDDVPLAKPEDLEERLKAAGDKALNLVLLHHGQKKSLQVQPKVKVTFGPVQPAPPEFWIGVSVTSVEPALKAQLQLPADQGLLATGVVEDSPAAKAGFKVNDILLSMNGKQLGDQAELVKLVQKNGDKPLAVEIVREGSRKTIEVTPERRKGPHLLTSKVQHTGKWNFVRPGAVLQEDLVPLATPELNWNTVLTDQLVNSLKTNPAQPHADPLANRLDTMASEIKELRKAVEELSKALKDRK
jgi:membrane-associated protease RseP (regulator of RpoE activity)